MQASSCADYPVIVCFLSRGTVFGITYARIGSVILPFMLYIIKDFELESATTWIHDDHVAGHRLRSGRVTYVL